MSGRPETRSREDGAVLLTTLMVMSLMAALAVSVMEDVSYAVRRAAVLDDSAQAEAYLDGAEGYVTSQLRTILRDVDGPQLNILFAEPQVYTLPIEDGLIRLTVSDATHCVSPADTLDANAERRFQRALVEIGVPRNEASMISAALKDWQDEDLQQEPSGAEDGAYLLLDPPYRTAGSPVSSVGELRALRGMTREVFEAVAPWICIDAAPTRINVNTLPAREAGLLAATLGKDIGFARGLIADRPNGGWASERFLSLNGIEPEPGSDDPPIENLDLLTFVPDRMRVDIRVAYRDTVRRGMLRVDMTGSQPRIIGRERGEAALPRAKFPPEDTGTNGGAGSPAQEAGNG